MAAITSALAAIGTAVSVGSTIAGVAAARKEAKFEDRAEDARKKSANLDALRRQRAVVREMQQQRAIALSNATVQGSSEGSGLSGTMAGITGAGLTNMTGIQQQNALGNQVFAANKQARKARTTQSTMEGLNTLGGTLVKNAGSIESIGTDFANLF
jgi:hypothetical protein